MPPVRTDGSNPKRRTRNSPVFQHLQGFLHGRTAHDAPVLCVIGFGYVARNGNIGCGPAGDEASAASRKTSARSVVRNFGEGSGSGASELRDKEFQYGHHHRGTTQT